MYHVRVLDMLGYVGFIIRVLECSYPTGFLLNRRFLGVTSYGATRFSAVRYFPRAFVAMFPWVASFGSLLGPFGPCWSTLGSPSMIVASWCFTQVPPGS